MTEVGVNCFAMTPEESRRKPGSIGKPMLFTAARIAETGELWLRGPHVCSGYWNNPDATLAALDGEGWFHTGDVARCDDEGFYYIAGRAKDMFISGGVNVYPAEVEAALLRHPSIAEAAVIGVARQPLGRGRLSLCRDARRGPLLPRRTSRHFSPGASRNTRSRSITVSPLACRALPMARW